MKTLDNRGQSIQIGAVILFGAAVVALSVYVATVVPQENKQVEFNHYENVKNQLSEIRSALENVKGDGVTETETVKLGTSYPPRILGLNPPPATGSLRTETKGDIVFNKTFDTQALCGDVSSYHSLIYSPNYNELNAQPIEYDNTALYVNNSGQYAFLDDQSLIEGTTIEIAPLNSSISESGLSRTTAEFKGGPADGSTKTVSSELVMTLPSRLPASEWETNDNLLADVDNVKSVNSAQNRDNAVNVTLEPDTYTVSCRAIGAGDFPASGAADPPGIADSNTTSSASTNESGYGKGTTQTYNEDGNNSDVIATKGGVLKEIVDVSELNTADPAFAPTRADDGQLQKKSRHLRVGVVLQNNSIGTTNYQKYHFIIGDPDGIKYDVDKNGVDWKSQSVSLISQTDGEDPEEVISGRSLDTSALDSWLLDGEELDLLNKNNYEKPDKVDSELSEVKSFLDNDEEVRLQIVEAHGRVRFDPSD